MTQLRSQFDLFLVLSFVAGSALAIVLVGIPERLRGVESRLLSAREFETTITRGRIKSISALVVSILFFGIALALVVALVKLNSEWLVLLMLFPGVFFLTNELPIAIFEVSFGVAPRFTARPIRFEVGKGVRRRGLLRAAVAIGFIMTALVISIVRWL